MIAMARPELAVITNTQEALTPPGTENLKIGDGGGNFGGMEPATREYVDLKIESAVARLEGKLDGLAGQLSRMPTTGAMILTVAGAGVAVLTLGLAILAFAGDRFDGGIGLADRREEQLSRDREQNDRIETILNQISAQSAPSSTTAAPAPAK